ncbi:MAG: hypothetical protein HQ556_14490 [Candidatus Marinimicrobia bacterium]|nr:hypothetical protein [Candidatus Neomarinimicrobiota bacterium]
MYTTVLHQLFPRVEIETFKVNGDHAEHVVWGERGGKSLEIHPDLLMDHVLAQKHSFVFPKADQIRLIRVWDKEGLFIIGYSKFLDAIGVQIESRSTEVAETANRYLQQLRASTVPGEPWTRIALIKMWRELMGVSIGAGANKEIIEANTFGQLSQKYAIDLEALIDATSKDITKAAKYIGRLLRPFRYYSMETPSIDVRDMEVDAFIDGWTCSVDINYCSEVLGIAGIGVGDRLEITAITDEGLLKGHGMVGDHANTNVILYGEQYKSIVKSIGLEWFAVEPLHGSDEAFLDIQTLVNLGTRVFPVVDLQKWISDTIISAVIKTRDTDLPSVLTDTRVIMKDPSKISSDKWSLRRMAMHELNAMLPVMVRRTYSFHRSGIRKLNNLRIRIPGAIRRYITPDLSNTVKPGSILIKGQSFFISKQDAGWLHRLHGGSDSDDSFVLIPIAENRALLYRNPNQLNEWSVMTIQESDHEFKAVNEMQLPLAQRYNIKSEDDTPEKIMETVSSFWAHIADSDVEVDEALLPRIPETYRDRVKGKAGWLSKLFTFADENLKLADEAITQYSREMSIPEQLITAPRSAYYETAKEMRGKYGHGLRKARHQNQELIKSDSTGRLDADAALQVRIDKVHGHIRGILNSYEPDAQKLIVRDLMRICYLELPGTVVSASGYELTQSNDGVLGIPSSPSGRSRGTWDILIDLLVEQGFGRELVLEDDVLTFHSYDTPRNYTSDGMAIRVIGGWRSVAHENEDLLKAEDLLVARAYHKTKHAITVEIHANLVILDGAEFGRIVSKTHVSDGKYQIVNAGSPGKSQVLHIAEC